MSVTCEHGACPTVNDPGRSEPARLTNDYVSPKCGNTFWQSPYSSTVQRGAPLGQLTSLTHKVSVLFALLAGLALPWETVPYDQATVLPPTQPVDAIYIRVNQIGYLPGEPKTAIVLTNADLSGQNFTVANAAPGGANAPMLTAAIGADRGAWGSFAHTYTLSFDGVATAGLYQIRVGSTASPNFNVSADAFKTMVPQTLGFFHEQRCGVADSPLHAACHLKDGIALGGPVSGTVVDATGGWHDAGDYIKFLITSGEVTNVLLTSYQRHPSSFAVGSSGLPDVLDEARVGLDWMLKLWDPRHQILYYQVGDGSDHNGWRLPETDDTLRPPRPVIACEPGKGANVAGKAAAALALASAIWSDPAAKFHDADRAARYLTAAQQIYAWGKLHPAAQPSTPEDFYNETSVADDMSLAAAELYRATHEAIYLAEAKQWADRAGDSSSFDWGSMAPLAWYEIARLDPGYVPTAERFLRASLTDAAGTAARANNPFHTALESYQWGSTSTMEGEALQALWYQDLSGDTTYASLARDQRDFILGANPWGVCFVAGAGTISPQHAHYGISFVSKLEPSGFWDEGPVKATSWNKQNIRLPATDPYAAFQSDAAVYHDDPEDYATNEPTLDASALGIALISWYTPQGAIRAL